MIIVIGSSALSNWTTLDRPEADLDLVCSYDEIGEFAKTLKRQGHRILAHYPIASGKKVVVKTDKLIVEADITWPGSVAEKLHSFVYGGVDGRGGWFVERFGVEMICPSLNFLYMLKMSHRYLKDSPHFLKTMDDIHAMRKLGAVIPEYMQRFYKERMADTYDYGHPKLNQSKDAFFTDTVPYVWDHDSTHAAMRHMPMPAYIYFKVDQAEVMCSKEKFFACDRQIQLWSVLEEAQVLSLERAITCFPGADHRKSFDLAQMKLSTSISSGYWREFAWENYHVVQAMYEDDYVARFEQGVKSGIVVPHKDN